MKSSVVTAKARVEVVGASVQTERPAAGKSKRGNRKQEGHAKQETD